MDSAVIPNDKRGNNHGELRRGVEGIDGGERPIESSYPGNRQFSWTDSHRYPNETEQAETDAVGSGASENFARTKGTMGKDKAVGTGTRAHDEQGSTQQDCCSTACSLGQGESTAKEGGVRKVMCIPAWQPRFWCYTCCSFCGSCSEWRSRAAVPCCDGYT